MPRNPLLEIFCGWMRPGPFFSGLILSLLLCSLAGRWASSLDLYGDRVRFMRKISPEGYVFPTPDHIIRFVEGKAPRDRILVLVGGSSKMLGTGQKNDLLWTSFLQKDLGPDYSVVNLGVRGGQPTAFLLPMAEILEKKYSRMIVVTDTASPDWLTPNYSYFLWQCRMDGLLSRNPSRERELLHSLKNGPQFPWLYGQELLLGSLFERMTASKNLWNYLGYQYFFPVYSPLAEDVYPKDPQFVARKSVYDDEYDYDIDKKVPERFLTNLDMHLKTARETLVRLIKDSGGKRVLRDEDTSVTRFNDLIPEERDRSRYLLLNVSISPYVLSKLSRIERGDYGDALEAMDQSLAKHGFQAMRLGMDYPYEAYNDAIHLSGDGAPLMARDVAEKIRDITLNKGWSR
jgi:hypothetical protein